MLLSFLIACPEPRETAEKVDADNDGATADVDCDDADPAVGPDADELCNGFDEDCDGIADDSPRDGITRYADADGDGFGRTAGTLVCADAEGYVDDNTDCDDSDADVSPVAEEVCDDVDNDCDDLVDDEDSVSEGTVQIWPDTDGDGYGSALDTTTACEAGEGWTYQTGDCDDNNAAVSPSANEICDGVDNDCDDRADDQDNDVVGGTTLYRDRDGDGVGDDARSRCDASMMDGYSTIPGDCDDSDASVWTGCTEPSFEISYDVVVVGSGPAGIAAALSAREMGATVLLLEKWDVAGVGTIAGQGLMAAGTKMQEDEGVSDSPDALIAEWEEITGEPGDQDSVRNFVTSSADLLIWLESYGVPTLRLSEQPEMGSVARDHEVDAGSDSDPYTLIGAFDGDLWLNTAAVAPVMWEDAVVGVYVEDTETGEASKIGAGAVVVATGGFQRDMDVVDEVLPGLSESDYVWECLHTSDGGGLSLLDLAGAAYVDRQNLGIYVHSIQDPHGEVHEGLTWLDAGDGIVVGSDGNRFYSEEEVSGFDLYHNAPAGAIWAVINAEIAEDSVLKRPFYNWTTEYEEYSLLELYGVSGDIVGASSIAELADAMGVDADSLVATVEAWNAIAEVEGTDPFGRDMTDAPVFDGDEFYGVRLSPGLAKSFGGVNTDPEARVIDEDDVEIPGLYAAGEVAGMLPGGGSGSGWGGAVAGCYYGGRIAGQGAATWALAD